MKNKKIFLISLILLSIILIIISSSINISACTGDDDNGEEENETETYCGNSLLEPGEECDWGLFNGFLCWAGYGKSCFYCSSKCESKTLIGGYCGDGKLDPCEECDDGNNIDGDRCSSLCKIEDDEESFCGDGIVNGSEECDDGNNIEGDGCSSDCIIEDDEEPVCEHDVAVRYTYSNSFGTGIAVGYANSTWISDIPAILTKEDEYKIKYYIDNKIADTINNINVIVRIGDSVLLDYNTEINVFHYKELSLNVSSLQCNNSYTIYLEVEKINETDCNLTDNYAQREIFILCGDNGDDDDGDDGDDDGDDDNGGTSGTKAIPNFLECKEWSSCINGVQTRVCSEVYGYAYYLDFTETRACVSNFIPLAYNTDFNGYFEGVESAYAGPKILETEPSYSGSSSKNKFSISSIISSGWIVFITFGLITLLILLIIISFLTKKK